MTKCSECGNEILGGRMYFNTDGAGVAQCSDLCHTLRATKREAIAALGGGVLAHAQNIQPMASKRVTLLVDRLGFTQTRDDVHGMVFMVPFTRDGHACQASFQYDGGDSRNSEHLAVYRETEWETVTVRREAPDVYAASKAAIERAVAELETFRTANTELLAENARLRRQLERKR